MSVVTRTNRATNPTAASTTGYAAVAGTGGVAALTNVATAGYSGDNFNRVTWSTATTAVSGGGTYTQTGLSATTFYRGLIHVRSSIAQRVQPSVTFRDNANATVNTVTGDAVVLAANTWTPLPLSGYSGAAVNNAVVTVSAVTGTSGVVWPVGATLDVDAVLIEPPTVLANNLLVNPLGRISGNLDLGGNATLAVGSPGAVVTHNNGAAVGNAFFGMQTAALVVGQTYYARFVADVLTGSPSLMVAYHSLVGASVNAARVTPVNGVLSRDFSFVATATSGRLLADFENAGTGESYRVREMVMSTTPITGYFDGSTVSTDATKQYLWSGAPNASASFQTYNLPLTYFDGSLTNAASTMYAWTGTANASTSTATTYTPALALVPRPLFDPTPRVEITLTDLTPTSNKVTLWRTADGKRQAVRGFRNRTVVTADYIIDYEAPLGRTVTYDVEVLSGINAQVAAPTASTSVNSASGAIQDPLVPSSTVPVYGEFGPDGKPYLRDQAMKDLEYAVDATLIPIMGSPDPVGILGQRMSARGVDMSMSTRAAQAAADMRNLLMQAPLVLVRPLPRWAGALPGLCYLAIGNPHEQPVDEAWGGQLIRWELVGDLVAAPTMNVLVALWTYGDVKALWGTYQQAQTALSGKTYLDVLKSPAGT